MSPNKVKRPQVKKKKAKKQPSVGEELVTKANKQDNPLSPWTAFHNFSRNELTAQLKCFRRSELSKELEDWIFDLLQRNMKKMYEMSDWGWDEKDKREEMMESAAWYLIAYSSEGKPLAFSHFRFDIDYDYPVLYCYEMQLEAECRRKGLGRFMLQILELMAFKNEMDKVVLTVFRHNPAAVSFFKSLGYTVDPTSPVDTLLEQFDYEILSKLNRKKAETPLSK